MLPYQIAEVLQRPHRNQRDLAGIPANQAGEEFDRWLGDGLIGLKVFRPRELVVDAIWRHRRGAPADRHRHVAATQPVQQLRRQPRPLRRVGVGHGHAHQLKDRALHRIPERPGIVDVRADVGVEDDLDPVLGWRLACR